MGSIVSRLRMPQEQGCGGQEKALRIVQGFNCIIHGGFAVRPDAEETLQQGPVDAPCLIVGQVKPVLLLKMSRPGVVVGLHADEGAPESGFPLPR